MSIAVIRRLRIKRQVKTLQGVLSSFFYSFSLPDATIKAFLEVSLVLLTIRACTFLKIFEKMQFRCTGLLHSSKLVHLEGNTLPCFT